MPARGYEFYPQAGILFIIHTPMARCCVALFLLAETEVAMKTVITSQVKKKTLCFHWIPNFRQCKNPGISSVSI